MTDCTDPADGQQLAAARSRQFLGAVVLLGLVAAMDGADPSGSENQTQHVQQLQRHQLDVSDCNKNGGFSCGGVNEYEMTRKRQGAEKGY
jgi:hypothetical protein